MSPEPKTSQLQIRVSASEKKALRHTAKQAGMDMSEYVLTRLFPPSQTRLAALVRSLATVREPSFVLAEIHDLLQKANPTEFQDAVESLSVAALTPYLQNYLSALIEEAAVQKNAKLPAWIKKIAPLPLPVFGSHLQSLRLHLLTHSPIPFRKRNIFIDSTLGDRV